MGDKNFFLIIYQDNFWIFIQSGISGPTLKRFNCLTARKIVIDEFLLAWGIISSSVLFTKYIVPACVRVVYRVILTPDSAVF